MSYLAKYLPEFGWEAVVVTRNAPGLASNDGVIRVGRAFATAAANGHVPRRPDHPLVTQLKGAVKSVVFFPDSAASWVPAAFRAAMAAHERRPFDAIVTSAMPASVHLVGWLLASRMHVPWIADYRDLWDGNPYVVDPAWRKKLLRELERRTLRKAETITTISESLATPLGKLHACGVRVIPNASDTAEWDDVPFARPDEFRVVHAGSLYDGKRSPRKLFSEIVRLRDSGDESARNVRLDFYGPAPGDLMDLAREYGLSEAVTYHGVVDRRAAMRAQRSAALLLVIQNDDPRTAHEYGSKIFEYEAAGRPVLVLGPPGSVLRDYVRDKKLGWFASNGTEIGEALREAYRGYASGNSLERSNGTLRPARAIAAEFAGLLPAS